MAISEIQGKGNIIFRNKQIYLKILLVFLKNMRFFKGTGMD